MNSLTYISRQFDVLASPVTSSPRHHPSTSSSAPPSPTAANNIPLASTSASPSLTEFRSRRPSQPSLTRKSSWSSKTPITSSKKVATSAPPAFTSHRESPGPRKRRRRRLASAFFARPFIAIWQLLYSAWLWVSQKVAEVKGYMSHGSSEGSLDTQVDDQSDVTLVDSDVEDEENVSLSLQDSMSSSSSSSVPRGSEKDPFPAPSSKPPASSPSSWSARSDRIQISIPSLTSQTRSEIVDPGRQWRARMTPYPSKERISVADEEDDREADNLREPLTPTLNVTPPLPRPDLPSALVGHLQSSQPSLLTPPSPPPAASPKLLPNRLGTSYLTSSSAKTKAHIARAPSPRPQTPFHMPKTLVLDLDETLIHSTSSRVPLPTTPSSGKESIFDLGGLFIGGGFGGAGLLGATLGGGLLAGSGGLLGSNARARGGHMVEVVLGGRSTLYTVYKRPFVDYFLRKVSSWYTVVIFTASMQEYADPVIDWLDAGRGILGRRFFRESCTQLPNGTYAKDLSIVDQDLSRVCMIDNSPVSYSIDQANGIPIEGWYSDPSDEALLDLLPVLDSLRFTSDVRRVLGIKAF